MGEKLVRVSVFETTQGGYPVVWVHVKASWVPIGFLSCGSRVQSECSSEMSLGEGSVGGGDPHP